MYEVAIARAGREMITGGGMNNPLRGLLNFPETVWTRITPRPIGLHRAVALARAQMTRAVVVRWGTAEKEFDNGMPKAIPAGWWPCDAQTAQDPRRAPVAPA